MPQNTPDSTRVDCSPDPDHAEANKNLYFPEWMLELEGTIVGKRLRLGQILGNGAFGVVYVGSGVEAHDEFVAVKVLSTSNITHERHRDIEREIRYHYRVSEHSNIVKLHGVIQDASTLYVIMDLHLEGDLFKCIMEDELYVGNDDLIKSVFVQLLDAVAFCHGKGIYHRDLKPENVLCRNGGSTVLLTDFGLATRHSLSKDFKCGSEFYMSPECIGFSGIKSYSTLHNDIWALGVILVNLVTSRNPWKRADFKDNAFAHFCEDPAGYLQTTLPLSRDAVILLSCIFKFPYDTRMSIGSIQETILRIDRLLLTPAEASAAKHPANETAVNLFEVIVARRPHMLVKHYEDLCAYFPDLAGGLCERLKFDMFEYDLVDNVGDIFPTGILEPSYDVLQEPSSWSAIPVEIRSEQLDEVSGYPMSPDMSGETAASEGPITPATHPTRVVDNVPEVLLDGVARLVDGPGGSKIAGSPEQTSAATLSVFSSRIARVLGSTGSFFR